MSVDHGRGIRPDAKRGKRYRRTLLQQGRPLVESDVAALVDGLVTSQEDVVRALGCGAASPDLGFLVTPGPLLAVFAEVAGDVVVTAGTAKVWVDYRFRYLDRYPALHLEAGPAGATVTIPLLQPIVGAGALWATVEATTSFTVNGGAASTVNPAPTAGAAQRVPIGAPPAGAPAGLLTLTLPANAAVGLFLGEGDADAGARPAFSVAAGSYLVDGLVVELPSPQGFPEVAFPTPAGFSWANAAALPGLVSTQPPQTGQRWVAYLEVWERVITHVEDPGMLDVALGGIDTSARTEVVSQVKIAKVHPSLGASGAEGFVRAFAKRIPSGGQVVIDVPPASQVVDPCALPELSGYAGDDNRLYRVEVHDGDTPANVRFKWSRDNGAELFAFTIDNGEVVLPADTPLADGDLVELLSNVTDLGDEALAEIGTNGFVPARRAVGELAELRALPSSSATDEARFRLVAFGSSPETAVTVGPRHGATARSRPKLRRWHGLSTANPASPNAKRTLESGIELTIPTTGAFRPGQWWQYEARAAGANANGPWQSTPHGPERRFAPLALLEYRSATEPLTLVAWLDERFSHPCELNADATAFSGARVRSESSTVQEALEELFEQPHDDGCGELVIRQEDDWDAVFATIGPNESRRICVAPGTWNVTKTVVVKDKGDLIISGAGGASWLKGNLARVLRFEDCGDIRIQDLSIVGGAAVESSPADGLGGAVSTDGCSLDLERVTVQCAGRPTRRASAVEVGRRVVDGKRVPPPPTRPEVRVRDCQIAVGDNQVGILAIDPFSVDIRGNTIICEPAARNLGADLLVDKQLAAIVAKRFMRRIVAGDVDPDGLLAGDGDIAAEFDVSDGRRQILIRVPEWGTAPIRFSTDLALELGDWVELFKKNPPRGIERNADVDPRQVASLLRAFVRRLLTALIRAIQRGEDWGSERPVVNDEAKLAFQALAARLIAENGFAAGAQGIVVGGHGIPIRWERPEDARVEGDLRPDVHIDANRVLGFVQGIHVGTSDARGERGLTYRTTITDNTVHLRVPGLARGRHGIFVGSSFHTRVCGNTVELVNPSGARTEPYVEAIRLFGTFGPLLHARSNLAVDTVKGVVATAVNAAGPNVPFDPAMFPGPGWSWQVESNAIVAGPQTVPEEQNW